MATGCGLNVGLHITADLRVGGGGTVYSNANARVGVGDSDTGPSAAQTGILGTAVYRAMDATYPLVTAGVGTTQWRATFIAGSIVNPIKEITVDNGAPAQSLVRVVLDVSEQFTPGVADIVQVLVTVPES